MRVLIRKGFGYLGGPGGAVKVVVLIVIAATAVAGLMVLARQVQGELVALRGAASDNVQWTMSQMEVDLLLLAGATEQTMRGRADLTEVRRRFDLFYSRVSTLSDGAFRRLAEDNDEITRRLSNISRALDDAIPVVDGPDSVLGASLASLAELFNALRLPVRELALAGVRFSAEISDRRRAALSRVLTETALTTLVLIIALVASIFFLFRQYRISLSNSNEVIRANLRLKRTVDASLDAIVVADADGKVIEYNPASEQTFGYSRAEAMGRRIVDLIVPERDRGAHTAGMERFRRTGEKRVVDAGRIEVTALRKDRSEVPIEMSIGSASGNAGPIFIAYIRDISRRIESERALLAARDEALAADRAKSSFLAVMSHEMRTPLNGIIGVLDLLESTPLSEDQRRLLDIAHISSNLLLRHIDDVLDIAKIESGKFALAAKPFDLDKLLNHAVELNLPLAAEKNTAISVESKLDEPAVFISDQVRIQQIVLNLINNAIKFTRNGHIRIGARDVIDEQGRATVEIWVEDSGIGIAAEDQKRIFDDFVSLELSDEQRASGAGLGLSIVRRIVTALGGDWGVASAPGKGSRFWVSLPIKRAPDAATIEAPSTATTAPAPVADHALTVLVVEDNEINRFVAKEMLQAFGCSVDEANDGACGVAMAKTKRFDLILMDISMPGMDGLEACRAIRGGNGLSRKSPIVGLTAHAMPEERPRYLDAGMEDCLIKPLRSSDLASIVEKHRPNRRPDAPEDGGRGERSRSRTSDLIDSDTLTEVSSILPPAVLRDKIRQFDVDLQAGLNRLAAAIGRADHEAVCGEAHKLAGSAALFGAIELRQALIGIESGCKAGDRTTVTAEYRRSCDVAARTIETLKLLAPEDADAVR